VPLVVLAVVGVRKAAVEVVELLIRVMLVLQGVAQTLAVLAVALVALVVEPRLVLVLAII
jgi:hypothetical protein